MIQGKCLFKSADSEMDGIRVLIARFAPKNVKENPDLNWDVHLSSVAPSNEILRLFKEAKIKFPEFARRYLLEMEDFPAQVGFRTIASLALNGNITLLCYEMNDTFCHRRYVKSIVEMIMNKCKFDCASIWTLNIVPIVKAFRSEYERKMEREKIDKVEKKIEEVNEKVGEEDGKDTEGVNVETPAG